MIKWIVLAVVMMNLLAFGMMGVDKRRARKHQWRISEKTLFLPVLLGGGLGGIVGMYWFHHKTKHWYFVIGFPLIFVVEGIAALCAFSIFTS